jgi:hypothetical protein
MREGDESGFGAAIINQPNGANTFPLTITPDTTDGFFRLQQTFSRDAAEKDVTITMKLTKREQVRYFRGVAREVLRWRHRWRFFR